MKSWGIALILSIGIHGAFFQLQMPSKKAVSETGNGIKTIAVRMVQIDPTPKPSILKPIEQKLPDLSKKPTQRVKTLTRIKSKPKPISQNVTIKPRTHPKPSTTSPPIQNPVSTQAQKRPRKNTVKELLSLKRIGPKKKVAVLQLSFQDLKGGYQVTPVYPLAARRERREGEVLLKIQILESGRIGALTIFRSSQSPDLDAAAIDAVRQWHFEPAIRNGTAIRQVALLPIRFNLAPN